MQIVNNLQDLYAIDVSTSLAYSGRRLVFVESSGFTKHLRRFLSDDEYGLLQKHLTERPDAGPIIRGTGGVRKIRWSAGGKGKRGGIRIIYYWLAAKDRIHLLVIYGKGEKEDLTPDDLKRVKALLEEIENGQA